MQTSSSFSSKEHSPHSHVHMQIVFSQFSLCHENVVAKNWAFKPTQRIYQRKLVVEHWAQNKIDLEFNEQQVSKRFFRLEIYRDWIQSIPLYEIVQRILIQYYICKR